MITGKEINRLALPAIISGIIEPVIALIDTAFVGQLGAAQLAGVGIASSFYLLLVWMLSQTKSAITAKVAKHFGSNTLDQIQSLVPLAFWLNLLLGLMVYLITNPLDREIFSLYGATGDVLEQAMCYFTIRAAGFPLVLGTMIIFGAFRGIQNTSWPMWSSMAAGVVNLVLDPILIFGVEGIVEPMGVAGAAWASLVAQGAMFTAALTILIRKTAFNIWPDSWRHPELSSMLKLSGDLFVRTLAMNVAYYLGNRQATLLGDAQIAAHTIAMNIWLFSSYFIDGYAEAAMVLSGRLKGEEDHTELRRVGLLLVKVCILIGAGMALTYALLYPYIGPFFSPDPVVQDLFSSIFWIVIASQIINGLAFAMDGIFNGLGDGRLMRNVLLVSTMFCFVPVVLFSQVSGWGLKGIWAAFFIWMVARGFPLFVSFIKRYPVTDVEVN
jgi:putative MATE family efflux protein